MTRPPSKVVSPETGDKPEKTKTDQLKKPNAFRSWLLSIAERVGKVGAHQGLLGNLDRLLLIAQPAA